MLHLLTGVTRVVVVVVVVVVAALPCIWRLFLLCCPSRLILEQLSLPPLLTTQPSAPPGVQKRIVLSLPQI